MSAAPAPRVDEIADGIYRISTAVPPDAMPGGFTFNQYLVVDEEPLLYHTGLRRGCAGLRAAIETVIPLERLRWIGLSHFEADECGALNELLAAAPHARPICGTVAALVSLDDFADRQPRPLADGEKLTLGRHVVQWIDTPHLPHAWECGHLYEETSRTLFCGDLLTQPGHEHPAITSGDVLTPSEELRSELDYFSQTREVGALIEKLAATRPTTLACMHGAAWEGDGAELLRALGRALG